ncbi:MAG: glycosyltransferase family 2 protein [Flavobacterium sp.]|nr:glycosyltransferase family 2 protein [Flavobacterium sp.]
MILVYHNTINVCKVVSTNNIIIPFNSLKNIIEVMQKLAFEYPDQKIVWCHETLEHHLNVDEISSSNLTNNSLVSFNPSNDNYLTHSVGYFETSPFVNILKTVTYTTWQMSSCVGYAHASVFLELKDEIKNCKDFDYYLTSLAKIYIHLGLFCYSEPKLLLKKDELKTTIVPTASTFTIFKFIKQHCKSRWVLLVLINFIVYEKRYPIFPFLFSLFYKKNSISAYVPSKLNLINSNIDLNSNTIDVLIPTIGRKKYLYDVLLDLKNQTVLPKNVIIIEQNGALNSVTELDYLKNEIWPFTINPIFTNTLGVCNARNLGLNEIKSKWVFLADDDIRFESNFLENCLQNVIQYNAKATTLSCLKTNEKIPNVNPSQWETFGSGCSFVLSEIIYNIRFNIGFEFGFGEDADFGRKIRNSGHDIIFFPKPMILHLKAPIGGFRTQFKFDWDTDVFAPKPSPTMMLYKILHDTKQETRSYKTVLFFKYYKKQAIKNPVKYYKVFKKQWNNSVFWANKLNLKSNNL